VPLRPALRRPRRGGPGPLHGGAPGPPGSRARPRRPLLPVRGRDMTGSGAVPPPAGQGDRQPAVTPGRGRATSRPPSRGRRRHPARRRARPRQALRSGAPPRHLPGRGPSTTSASPCARARRSASSASRAAARPRSAGSCSGSSSRRPDRSPSTGSTSRASRAPPSSSTGGGCRSCSRIPTARSTLARRSARASARGCGSSAGARSRAPARVKRIGTWSAGPYHARRYPHELQRRPAPADGDRPGARPGARPRGSATAVSALDVSIQAQV